MTNQTLATISSVEFNRNEREDKQVSISLVSPVIVQIQSEKNGFVRAHLAPTPKPKSKHPRRSSRQHSK